ncbi:hypothetical protein DAEQUDRAFT_38953 [Daedalea quercina L-15889]|uniref:Uncharacterized protein n=1 Tax=Daedalea quercina L-15889 TaxID=1314783 RepID=A0A165LEN1_9APHY|nr:hypothetical protein DAEQUDRAFT_38953 [Daedalea quercina L-15889]
MRFAFASVWFVAVSTLVLMVSVGPQSVSGLTAANFAQNIFHKVKEVADKTHDGIYHVVHDATRLLGERETLEQFWDYAFSVAQRAQRYAGDLINEAAREADKTAAMQLHHVSSVLHVIVSDTEGLRETVSQFQAGSFDDIQHDIEKLFADLLEELKEQFPPPDHAPNHEERKGNVSLVIRKAEEAFIKFGMQHGMSEEQLRTRLEPIMKHVEDVVVTIGDLAEQHPVLFQTIMISGIMLIIPESWFLRPLFRLFGMAPEGPVAGSTVAWAQRRFYGAYIPKGSWFSHLQHAGMKAAPWLDPVKKQVGGSILAGIGLAGGLFAGYGR